LISSSDGWRLVTGGVWAKAVAAKIKRKTIPALTRVNQEVLFMAGRNPWIEKQAIRWRLVFRELRIAGNTMAESGVCRRIFS
jgi:hypothetical protein